MTTDIFIRNLGDSCMGEGYTDFRLYVSECPDSQSIADEFHSEMELMGFMVGGLVKSVIVPLSEVDKLNAAFETFVTNKGLEV